MAEKKYINHKKFNSKLNYIIRAYGLSGVISEKIKKAIKESEPLTLKKSLGVRIVNIFRRQKLIAKVF